MFRSFFIAGFEGSTGFNRHGRWFDQIAATGHDLHADADYRRIADAGFAAARECVRWPLVDPGTGRFDFSSIDPMIDAARRHSVEVIWDLFHFGYPAKLDPLGGRAFRDRFAAYCAAAARYIAARTDDDLWFTPVNEPSYLAYAAGEQALFAPHLSGCGHDLKLALVQAAIAGIDAIRSVCPTARFLSADPLCRVVAPAGRPDLADSVDAFNSGAVFQAWDILAGRLYPELGGSPAHLDVVGINYYWTNQWEMEGPKSADGVALPLADDDPRRVPLSDLVAGVMDRYGADVVISETSHHGDGRSGWVHEIGQEVQALAAAGRRLGGVCIYPILGMRDWHEEDRHVPMGLWEPCAVSGTARLIHEPMAKALRQVMPACDELHGLTGRRLFRRAAR